jgi:hypothetical protein
MNVHELVEKNGNYFIKHGTGDQSVVFIPVSNVFVALLKAKDSEIVIEKTNGFVFTVSYNHFIRCMNNLDDELKDIKNFYTGSNYDLSIDTYKMIRKRINMEHMPSLDAI